LQKTQSLKYINVEIYTVYKERKYNINIKIHKRHITKYKSTYVFRRHLKTNTHSDLISTGKLLASSLLKEELRHLSDHKVSVSQLNI